MKNLQFLPIAYMLCILAVTLAGSILLHQARATSDEPSEQSPNPRNVVPTVEDRIPVEYQP